MDQLDNVMSVIAITVCKGIQKIITKLHFLHQAHLKKRGEEDLSGIKNPF